MDGQAGPDQASAIQASAIQASATQASAGAPATGRVSAETLAADQPGAGQGGGQGSRRRRWRSLRRPARWAVLLAGALPVLAFPDANVEILAWFGLVPGLMLMALAPTGREAFTRGWWFGAGYLLAAMYWLAPNLGPGLLLVAIVIGFLWSGVGLAARATLRPPVTPARAVVAVALVPSAWLTTEWLRSWQGIGGPWAVLGVSQWQHPAVLALAAVGGVWLVTFALVAANTGLAVAILARSLAPRLIGCAAALVAVGAGPVAFALTAPSPVARKVTIALVQPGSYATPDQRIAASDRLTAGPARQADLVVWGESSVGYDLASYPALRLRLQALSASIGAQILASQDSVSPAGAHSKVAVLIGGNGIDGEYVKSRLVPFGEYIPFRSELGWLTSISRAATQNMVAGNGARVLHATLRGGRRLPVGVLICFESAFPDMSRYDADHGAQVIIYQTSDATFQGSWAMAQHASLSALRAAETGRPAVQAALTGDSAAFDARGRLLAWTGGADRGVVLVTLPLPPASARTPFDRLGDFVPWTALLIVGLAMAFGPVRMGMDGRVRPATGRPHRRARIQLQSSRAPEGPASAPCVSRRARRGRTPTGSAVSVIPGRPPVRTPPAITTPARRGGPRRGLAAITICAAAGLLATACSGGTASTASGGSSHSGAPKASKSAAPKLVTITPANGSRHVKPGQGITVTAEHGSRLTSVTVRAGGDPVSGTMNAARTTWHSKWALAVSTRYTVRATSTQAGKPATTTSSFSTLRPAATARVMIFEGYHATYGVGMPIMLTFSHPVTNKAAVERSLQVTTSKPVVGAWAWDGDSTLSFRPREYWPAHTRVTFTGHLNGVEFAPGVYGDHTLTQSFSIGRSLIVVASTASHHMRLYRDGKLYRRWPISTGRPGDNTPNGTYLTIDKGNPVLMKGPGYKLEVPWSVRFTWSGDYLHDAYWSVGQQGFTNVSHGCVNMAPADAEAYYKMEYPGDPVTVTGSPRAGQWDNGWTHWFLTWEKFVRGSALHKAVEAGPNGSKFVSPSSLPPMSGSAPLSHPDPSNWSAS